MGPLRHSGRVLQDAGTRFAPLVGRAAELDAIERLLGGVSSQHGAAILISGAPGIGKSRLLAEARERAVARDFRVLATAGAETETDLPFAGPSGGAVGGTPARGRATGGRTGRGLTGSGGRGDSTIGSKP